MIYFRRVIDRQLDAFQLRTGDQNVDETAEIDSVTISKNLVSSTFPRCVFKDVKFFKIFEEPSVDKQFGRLIVPCMRTKSKMDRRNFGGNRRGARIFLFSSPSRISSYGIELSSLENEKKRHKFRVYGGITKWALEFPASGKYTSGALEKKNIHSVKSVTSLEKLVTKIEKSIMEPVKVDSTVTPFLMPNSAISIPDVEIVMPE